MCALPKLYNNHHLKHITTKGVLREVDMIFEGH